MSSVAGDTLCDPATTSFEVDKGVLGRRRHVATRDDEPRWTSASRSPATRSHPVTTASRWMVRPYRRRHALRPGHDDEVDKCGTRLRPGQYGFEVDKALISLPAVFAHALYKVDVPFREQCARNWKDRQTATGAISG